MRGRPPPHRFRAKTVSPPLRLCRPFSLAGPYKAGKVVRGPLCPTVAMAVVVDWVLPSVLPGLPFYTVPLGFANPLSRTFWSFPELSVRLRDFLTAYGTFWSVPDVLGIPRTF